ncbi:zinc finger protein 836-like [Sitophilus oryzae]|uniref:Zinc finger protein 836-like n=1 Tax=Sitophilus oryzae TaxID=7048 RepID=A0A6J2YP49_SITOR|nr:zinc finger protein 836-like [Sitophilus oryzae]
MSLFGNDSLSAIEEKVAETKLLMEKYQKEYNIKFNPFTNTELKISPEAKSAKRKELQMDPLKRKESSKAFKYQEFKLMVRYCNEECPDDMGLFWSRPPTTPKKLKKIDGRTVNVDHAMRKIDVGQHLPIKVIKTEYPQLSEIFRNVIFEGNQCPVCGKQFKRKDHVQRHYLEMHLSKENRYGFPCKLCKKLFKRKYLMENHEKICLGVEKGRRCFITTDQEIIGQVIDLVHNGASIRKAASKLNISKSSVHTILKKYRANVGVHFLNLEQDSGSLLSKGDDDEDSLDTKPFFSPFDCKYCSKIYSVRRSLWRHEKYECKQLQKPFACVVPHWYTCYKCGKVYKNKPSFIKHVNVFCGLEPKFFCKFPGCGYKSHMKSNLKRHTYSLHYSSMLKTEPSF